MPISQHPPQLICFDMDDTLIQGNSWLRFNLALGVSQVEDDQLYARFAAGEIDYAEWIAALHELYRLPRPEIDRAFVQTVLSDVSLVDGAANTLTHIHQAGITTALITGSFRTTATAVATQLNIPHVYANTDCVYKDQGQLTHLVAQGDEGAGKLAYVEELCRQRGLTITQDVMIVGDSSNDIPAFLATKQGVTFDFASSKVQAAARSVVPTLSDIIQLI
ncbi:MAG: HAD family hydrolase [Patescibacteria group bacterium]